LTSSFKEEQKKMDEFLIGTSKRDRNHSQLKNLPDDVIRMIYFHFSVCLDNSVLIEKGMLKLLEFKHSQKLLHMMDNSLIEEAAYFGQDCIIRWLLRSGFVYSRHAFDFAAQQGHMSTLYYFASVALKGTLNALNWAAEKGNLDVVQFLVRYQPEHCNLVMARRISFRVGQDAIFSFLNSLHIQ